MPQPAFAFVTDVQCTCGYPVRSFERPELPIVYDERTSSKHAAFEDMVLAQGLGDADRQVPRDEKGDPEGRAKNRKRKEDGGMALVPKTARAHQGLSNAGAR